MHHEAFIRVFTLYTELSLTNLVLYIKAAPIYFFNENVRIQIIFRGYSRLIK